MKKLVRSKNDRIIFGICGGIGEYFNIDASIIRLVFFLLAIPSFGTIALLYLVSAFIIPEDSGYIYADRENNPIRTHDSAIILGIGLIIIGSYLLLRIVFPEIRMLHRFWPALLIVFGTYLLISNKK